MNNELEKIKTNADLLKAIQDSLSKKITAEEIREQRASFVFGSMSSSSNVTKLQVKQFLAEHDCR